MNNNHNYDTTIFVHPGSDMHETSKWSERINAIFDQIPSRADTLKPIIQFLVATISPAKIYMLNYESGQNNSEYIDLFIVISGKTDMSFTELEPILDIAYLKDQRVSCSLHNERNVLEGLHNGHIFYSLNFTPDNLVYDNKNINYPITPAEALQAIKQQAFQKFIDYYNKATDFYDSALSLREIRVSPITLFMLHQTAELIYRGLLLSLNGYEKKTHEIRVLKKSIRRYASQLNEYFPCSNENEERLLNILDTSYLRARYKDSYAIDDNDVAILFDRVKQLLFSSKNFVKAKLENT